MQQAHRVLRLMTGRLSCSTTSLCSTNAILTIIAGFLVELDAARVLGSGASAYGRQTIIQHYQPLFELYNFYCQCSLLGGAGCSKGTRLWVRGL